MSNFFKRLRLDYIDWRLVRAGSLRRSDLTTAFGISIPQASADIKAFQEEHPGAMLYDATHKVYVRNPIKRSEYQPRRPRPGLAAALGWK